MNIFKNARELAKTANAWIWTAFVFAIFDEVVLGGKVTDKVCKALDGKKKATIKEVK